MKSWVVLDPTGTLPNPTLNGLAESTPIPGFEFGAAALVRPEHPDKPAAMTIAAVMIKTKRFRVPLRIAKGMIAGVRFISMV
ncbi:MAG: hypothetical protein ACYDD2_01405 [Candidatus Acidiferrales bacterium]